PHLAGRGPDDLQRSGLYPDRDAEPAPRILDLVSAAVVFAFTRRTLGFRTLAAIGPLRGGGMGATSCRWARITLRTWTDRAALATPMRPRVLPARASASWIGRGAGRETSRRMVDMPP